MYNFDIPVVLFIFKRTKAVEVLKRIREVRPKKLYLLADAGRNEEEAALVAECRKQVEACIDWECELIKKYAEENRGVWGNIALGAEWVFQREEKAIFLEDDNLPEVSFFRYCEEMLEKYEDDTRVLWVCGTNYLGEYTPEDGSSYVFTRHMLPCGWASWSKKFLKYYDKEMKLLDDPDARKRAKKNSYNSYLYRQYFRSWIAEKNAITRGRRPISWDYQMDFAVKVNGLYGISPCVNQITNIGVDIHSIHGGSNSEAIMTKRFCGVPSSALNFPLKHPQKICIDKTYEKKIAHIVAYPIQVRLHNLRIKIQRYFRTVGKG